jgi:hypothetical protein
MKIKNSRQTTIKFVENPHSRFSIVYCVGCRTYGQCEVVLRRYSKLSYIHREDLQFYDI